MNSGRGRDWRNRGDDRSRRRGGEYGEHEFNGKGREGTSYSLFGRGPPAVSASTTDATRQAPTSVISYETERESVSEARSKALGGNDGVQRYHPGAWTPDMNPSPPPSANGD